MAYGWPTSPTYQSSWVAQEITMQTAQVSWIALAAYDDMVAPGLIPSRSH